LKHNDASATALDSIPSIPRDSDGPVFAEPWQAEVFAITLSLYEGGLITWPEWAAELSEQISLAQQQGDPDLGDTYYVHWLGALESIVMKKKLGDANQLSDLYNAWHQAALSTPHGQVIELSE